MFLNDSPDVLPLLEEYCSLLHSLLSECPFIRPFQIEVVSDGVFVLDLLPSSPNALGLGRDGRSSQSPCGLKGTEHLFH